MVSSWENWQIAKRTAIEYLAVFIATMAFAVTIFVALGAAYFVGQAHSKLDAMDRSYKELATEYRLAVLEIDAFNVALAKANIEVDHSGHAHKGDKP